MIIKIFFYSYSVFNLILLNIYLFLKKVSSKKKIIFFYHPKENLTKIHTYYIEDFLLKFQNYTVFFGAKILLFRYFYIKESLLNYIYNVDIFISNNICNNFTKNSKKIYLHHDIYDTPLTEKKKEREVANRLNKYDFVLLASKKSEYLSKKIFANLKKKPKLLFLGFYPKLNYLLKEKVIKKKNNKNIIIAPTDFNAFPELTMQPYLEEVITKLLKEKYEITYRPHPSNAKLKKVLDLIKKFDKYQNFKFDISSNYYESYSLSNLMITDISGTAYTYAFLTKNPVIFYSRNEKKIQNSFYRNLNFFKDRSKIGKVFLNTRLLVYFLKKNRNNKFRITCKKNIIDIYKKNFSNLNHNILESLYEKK